MCVSKFISDTKQTITPIKRVSKKYNLCEKSLIAGVIILASTNSIVANADPTSLGITGIDAIVLKSYLDVTLDGTGIKIGQVEVGRPGLMNYDQNGEWFKDGNNNGIYDNGANTDLNGDGLIYGNDTAVDLNGNGVYDAGFLNYNQNVTPADVFVRNQFAPQAPIINNLPNANWPTVLPCKGDPACEFDATDHGIDASSHATQVAGVMISTQNATLGVAPGASLYSSAYNVALDPGQSEALLSAQHIAVQGAQAINYSFGEATTGVGEKLDGSSKMTLGLDWLSSTSDTLNVVAGNEGTNFPIPTDHFNGLTVGYTRLKDGVFRELNPGNTFDEDADGARRSIDLVAPGTDIGMTTLNNGIDNSSGTSFAAPHVTATVALLQQYGEEVKTLPMADPLNASYDPEFGFNILDDDPRRHEVMKVVLMNSADKVEDILGMKKTIIDTAETFVDNGAGAGGTANNGVRDGAEPFTDSNGDGNYNIGGDNWLASDAYDNESIPLDDQMGTGQLNARRALSQFAAGEHDSGAGIFSQTVPKIGWDWGSSEGGDADDIVKYGFENALKENSYATITLAWDREIELLDNGADGDENTNDAGQNNGIFDIGEAFNVLGLANLDLYLMPEGETDITKRIKASKSVVDSVEHIFFKIPETAEYEFWVSQVGASTNLQEYAVAWQVATVPLPPSLYLAASGLFALVGLGRRKQKAA